jgi:hypothetical protein
MTKHVPPDSDRPHSPSGDDPDERVDIRQLTRRVNQTPSGHPPVHGGATIAISQADGAP